MPRAHNPDDLSAWRAIRVAFGLAPRPDMTPQSRLRRTLKELKQK
ncbi:hypothetical protein [Mycolicibacterium fortuitum]|nr:hypothetical protein [Mycolicibacterium fortuitum]